MLVTAFGADPDGNRGTLLRVWDQSGASGPLRVQLPAGLMATQALPVDLRGQRTDEPVNIAEGAFTFGLGGYAPASFILR